MFISLTVSIASPPASSSLHAHTLTEAPEVKPKVGDVPEVKQDVKDVSEVNPAGPSTSTALITTTPLPSIDFATILRSNPTFQALRAQGILGDHPASTITKLFRAVKESPEGITSAGKTPKQSSYKVFSNGFFMTFERMSKDKVIWRCEYRGGRIDCRARMHTDFTSVLITSYKGNHTHIAPSHEEVKVYGIDPTQIEENQVYIVNNTRVIKRRREVQMADALALSDVGNNEMPTSSAAAASLSPSTSSPAAGASSASMSSPHAMLLAQFDGFQSGAGGMSQSPNLPLLSSTPSRPPSAKRRAVEDVRDDNDLRRDPLFEPTYKIVRELQKLWKKEPSRYPRICGTPSTHFEFFVSKKDGSDKHLYVPLRIEQRDEDHLKEALQKFVRRNCTGMLIFGISPKISVMINQTSISSWENNQFFLLDISDPTRWRLMYVDDRAN